MMQIPAALRAVNTWLLWKKTTIKGEKKPRKVPYYVNGVPRNGAQGSPQDRAALAPYATALKVMQEGGYTGLGFALMPETGLVALDFDNCFVNGVLDPRVGRLVAGTYSEVSPSGVGIRAFMLGTLKSRKDNAGEAERNADGTRKDGQFDVEFFGDNGFVTITGNATDDCDFLGLTDTVCELTDEVRQLYQRRFGNAGALVVQSGEADDLMGLSATLGWTMDQARGFLDDCDPSASREQWLNALMDIHHEFSGSPEALDMVDAWSATSPKYAGRADVQARWASFGRGSGSCPVTGKSLLKWRGECLAQAKYVAVDEWKKEIASATDETFIREKICPKIRVDVRIDDMGRYAISQLLKDTFARMGTKYKFGLCEKLVTAAPPEVDRHGMPPWLAGWVYVTDRDKFYKMDSDEWLTMQGFNAKMNREMAVAEDGKRAMQAAEFALDVCGVPSVTRAIYLPWCDPLFTIDGVSCVNTYRPSSPPTPVRVMSSEGIAARDIVIEHLRLISGGRDDVVRTFVNWMAFNVQHPGVKIRWAPLVKGVEGDGKSVLGDLMSAVVGRANVRNVSPKVLNTDFTGWAEGSSIVVLEEIKLHGHNRFDILNALKPFITNTAVEIHKKGQDGRDNLNTVNYMAFTNYADALPLTETDRRWWIVFTPFASLKELAAAIGQGDVRKVTAAYFDKLHLSIHQNAAELRRWLLDHHIDADFKPDGSAPMTDEKTVMIGMSVSDEERTVREILERGCVGVTQKIFASSYLSHEAFTSDSEINLLTSALSRMLIKMGYTRLPKKLKWRGKTEIVWVLGHKDVSLIEARRLLDATVDDKGSLSDDLF